eukprot:14769721-Heterocapsa_arctica.AAC.1
MCDAAYSPMRSVQPHQHWPLTSPVYRPCSLPWAAQRMMVCGKLASHKIMSSSEFAVSLKTTSA